MQIVDNGGFIDKLAIKSKRRPNKVKLPLHVLSKSFLSISTLPNNHWNPTFKFNESTKQIHNAESSCVYFNLALAASRLREQNIFNTLRLAKEQTLPWSQATSFEIIFRNICETGFKFRKSLVILLSVFSAAPRQLGLQHTEHLEKITPLAYSTLFFTQTGLFQQCLKLCDYNSVVSTILTSKLTLTL